MLARLARLSVDTDSTFDVIISVGILVGSERQASPGTAD